MQECKHKRKFKATDVDCCTEGNVLSNNFNKLSQILYLLEAHTTLLKEYELANYFRIK